MASSSIQISDSSGVIGDTQRAKVVAKKKGWSDLDLSLKLHPIRKDIVPLRDEKAVKNAVKNLILTNFYERPFQAATGANLRGLLFEPADEITKLALQESIQRVLQDYEPRVRCKGVYINDLSDQNANHIQVKFLIKEYDSNENVEIVLRRLR